MKLLRKNEDIGMKDKYTSSEDFIHDVVEDCLENFTEDDKEYLCDHPYVINHHFGYGLFVRNQYIYKYNLRFEYEPDDLSSIIVGHIISKVTDYDISDPFYWRLYSHEDFLSLKRAYRRIYGNNPDELVEKYHEKITWDYTDEELVTKILGFPPQKESGKDDEVIAMKEKVIHELIHELKELVQK